MKKRMILGVLCAVLMGVTACGSSGGAGTTAAAGTEAKGTEAGTEAKASEAGTEAGTTAPAAATPEKTLKLGHSAPTGSSLDMAVQNIVAEIEEKTGGKLHIEVYPDAQLGDENVMLNSLMSGTLDMDLVGTPILATVMPEFNAMSLPFLFKNAEEFFGVVTQESFVEKTNAIANTKGIELLGYPNGEMRGLSNVKHEVRKPEDLKGLKIRVMSGSMYTDMFQAMGAITSTIPFGEVYTALQQGVVDGEDNGLNMLDMMKFMEVEKYHTALGHTVQTNPLVVSKDVWDGLSPEWQQIIRDAVRAQENAYLTEILNPVIEQSKKTCEENGVSIIMELTDEEYQAFNDCVQPVYEKYKADIGEEFYDYILKAVEDYRK